MENKLAESFVKDLKKAYRTSGDSIIAKKQTAYLRNLFPFFGIMKPVRAEIEREIFKKHPIQNAAHLNSILQILWQKEEREYQYAALNLATRSSKLWTKEHLDLFEKMIREKSWWDSVDTIASNLVGKLIFSHTALLSNMDKWIQDENMWIRRTAIICQLKWKAKTDEKRLFSYCEKCMHEKEFFIRKAIGWALREYAKTNPKAVKAFVQKNEKHLSPLSIREAIRRL